MEKYISYEKMLKKQQKLVNASKRGSWGNVKPITKVKESAKVYSRKKQNSQGCGYSFGGCFFGRIAPTRRSCACRQLQVLKLSEDGFAALCIGNVSYS